MVVETAEELKDQGNKEYKAGNWLKAAAIYSKGLKLEPANAVLLSNRSAALLKLNKVQKALADAEECIKQRPDWDKGHFRKATVLETLKDFNKALVAYQEASRLNPDNKEVALKVKSIGRVVRNAQASKQPTQNGTSAVKSQNSNSAVKSDSDSAPVEVQVNAGNSREGEQIPHSEPRLQEFIDQIFQLVEREIQDQTAEKSFPCVFFLPGRLSKENTEQMGQVSIQAAFESPSTLANATSFLREYGTDTGAQAAMAIVPKQRIAYPQGWLKPGWPVGKVGKADGFFVQLEAPGQRKLWFIPIGQKSRAPIPIKEKFAILEALFR